MRDSNLPSLFLPTLRTLSYTPSSPASTLPIEPAEEDVFSGSCFEASLPTTRGNSPRGHTHTSSPNLSKPPHPQPSNLLLGEVDFKVTYRSWGRCCPPSSVHSLGIPSPSLPSSRFLLLLFTRRRVGPRLACCPTPVQHRHVSCHASLATSHLALSHAH